ITQGNTGNVFAINEGTGALTTAGALDFENTSTYTLTVSVSDGSLSATADITVNVTDVDEATETVNTAPAISDQTFSVPEDAPNGTAVGTVQASDAETNNLMFSITAGNTGDVFTIVEGTGAITVAGTLDFETAPIYTLTVSVSDGELSATADITVNVTDVNEAPAIARHHTFSVPEDAENGTAVGTVLATDPEEDDLMFSITQGNTGNVFDINRTTGVITTAGSLDFENNPNYTLTVSVSDGGLSATADITVNVTVVVPFAIVDAEIETSVASKEHVFIRWTGGPGWGDQIFLTLNRPRGGSIINRITVSGHLVNVRSVLSSGIGQYSGEISYGGETIRFRVNVVAPDGWTRVRTNGTGIVNDNLSAFQALGLGRNRAIVLRTAEWELYELPESNTRPWRTNGSNRIGAPQCLGNWACNTAGLWPEGNTDFWVRAYPEFVQNISPSTGGTSITRRTSVGSSIDFKVKGGSGDIRWQSGSFISTGNTFNEGYGKAGTFVVIATDNITKETVKFTVEVK
ncbi:MAG: cadherin repeat domain-containing protein, partial [Ekhidna sp.]|nr:cadherin repeat domain-containing protein [Ekhidna sp.]